ncbi:hypothetical protein KAR52_00960 [Candidatus Pacearchaeota archaeon]|nr:hypothetical protein [Candidatus Pacearchaeota archaeon]
MDTLIIAIFLWLFGIIFGIFSNPQRKDFGIVRQSFFWIGIVLDILGTLALIPFVISWF